MAHFAPHVSFQTTGLCQSIVLTDDSNYNSAAEPGSNVDNVSIGSLTLRRIYSKDMFGNQIGSKDLEPNEFTAEFPINIGSGVFCIIGIFVYGPSVNIVAERGAYLSCVVMGGL